MQYYWFWPGILASVTLPPTVTNLHSFLVGVLFYVIKVLDSCWFWSMEPFYLQDAFSSLVLLLVTITTDQANVLPTTFANSAGNLVIVFKPETKARRVFFSQVWEIFQILELRRYYLWWNLWGEELLFYGFGPISSSWWLYKQGFSHFIPSPAFSRCLSLYPITFLEFSTKPFIQSRNNKANNNGNSSTQRFWQMLRVLRLIWEF